MFVEPILKKIPGLHKWRGGGNASPVTPPLKLRRDSLPSLGKAEEKLFPFQHVIVREGGGLEAGSIFFCPHVVFELALL